jgi:GNAT superfamily N-acetyltransferase
MTDVHDAAPLALLRTLSADGGEREFGFLQRMAAWLASEGERRTTWMALVSREPVGMVSLFEYRRMPKPGQPDSCWGYVGNLFVRPEFRQRGIGTELLGRVVSMAGERQYARLVVSPSPAAMPLFHHAGFAMPTSPGEADPLLVRSRPAHA